MGLEAAKQLAQRGLKVVLTSRDEEKGRAALDGLRAAGVDVDYHQLDVTDHDSAVVLAAYLKAAHGRCDVLVNNAATVFDAGARHDQGAASVFNADLDVIRKSIETNTLSAVMLAQQLVPLMLANQYGRIVNVSSGLGQLSAMGGGWPGFRVSKAALSAVTCILADELHDKKIKVNAVCPGLASAQIGAPSAPRSVEDGVDTTVWLATLREDGPTGGLFRDCKRLPW